MQDEKIEDLIDNVILCLQQLSAPTRFYGAHRQSVSPFDEPSFAGRHTFQVEYSSVVSHDYRVPPGTKEYIKNSPTYNELRTSIENLINYVVENYRKEV